MRVRLTVTPRIESPDKGRWTGKPVRIRRGPATVTGEAPACESEPLVPRGTGKARKGRPGSQETSLRPQSPNPRGKGWLLAVPPSFSRPRGRPSRARPRAPARPRTARARRPHRHDPRGGQGEDLRRGAADRHA